MKIEMRWLRQLLPVCPMGAIYIDPAHNRARINADECVERSLTSHGSAWHWSIW